ncbi:MAG: hypothetical protein JSS02_20195 [Planctomycetes bacterium]|nr:hypothetical protein [Planctomycetota bacterium]
MNRPMSSQTLPCKTTTATAEIDPAGKRKTGPGPRHRSAGGVGQLTLVEHALCPLDVKSSLAEGKTFEAEYLFCDANRHMQSAHARIYCPLGLSAGDEFFLWGLLGITLAAKDADHELHATPHYSLRHLGLIDQHARRGGRQYQQFTAAIERLAAVRYQNDCFYDPIRGEHRKVSFGFLSYSLPLDSQSSRAWRIVWDPIFFEFMKAAGGYLWFDLETYRALDPAARRLFLFLSKILSRRRQTLHLDLRHVGVHILGFSATLETKDLKIKVNRCVQRLTELEVVAPPVAKGGLFDKLAPGNYRLTVQRGNYFERRTRSSVSSVVKESPLVEPLAAIGLDEASIGRLLRQYPHRLLREWADITLAAQERHGPKFFKRSPQAYFIDNVKHAAQGNRTPPDWWHDLRKAEERTQAPIPGVLLRPIADGVPAGNCRSSAAPTAEHRFDQLRQELVVQLVADGTPKPAANQRAAQIARAQVRHHRPTARQSLEPLRDLLPKFPTS